jgi:DMSO/TMAO reductase YedYZ molybdopterin-dependent catalytic subunit
VTVHELLVRAGVPLGDNLRGAALQLVVIARSHDGYAVVFALADFDDTFSSRTILLAEREDGKPLPDNAAPFRLVAPGDKKAARWARMVTSLEIASVGSAASPAKQ